MAHWTYFIISVSFRLTDSLKLSFYFNVMFIQVHASMMHNSSCATKFQNIISFAK